MHPRFVFWEINYQVLFDYKRRFCYRLHINSMVIKLCLWHWKKRKIGKEKDFKKNDDGRKSMPRKWNLGMKNSQKLFEFFQKILSSMLCKYKCVYSSLILQRLQVQNCQIIQNAWKRWSKWELWKWINWHLLLFVFLVRIQKSTVKIWGAVPAWSLFREAEEVRTHVLWSLCQRH